MKEAAKIYLAALAILAITLLFFPALRLIFNFIYK